MLYFSPFQQKPKANACEQSSANCLTVAWQLIVSQINNQAQGSVDEVYWFLFHLGGSVSIVISKI